MILSPEQTQARLNAIRKILDDSESGEMTLNAALDAIHEISEAAYIASDCAECRAL